MVNRPQTLVPERFFQSSPFQVSLPVSPGRGTEWNVQTSFEAADRVHAVTRQPHCGTAVPDPGERVAGVGEDIVCVEVDVETGSGTHLGLSAIHRSYLTILSV